MTEVRVRLVTTGHVRGKRRPGPLRYLPGGWSDETLPVNAFAVEHPQGICLFDTGQTARAAEPGYHPRWHPFLWLSRFELEPKDEVASQLDPETVRWVVLSHLHTDHVGGLSAFMHAEVLVSRVEWERAAGLRGRLRGYLPQHWPTGVVPHLVDFGGPSVGPFAGSYDVAGDAMLRMVPLPGHTPGHSGLIVDERVLLAGDAAATRRGFAAACPEIAQWCDERGIVVAIAHDPAAGVSEALDAGDPEP